MPKSRLSSSSISAVGPLGLGAGTGCATGTGTSEGALPPPISKPALTPPGPDSAQAATGPTSATSICHSPRCAPSPAAAARWTSALSHLDDSRDMVLLDEVMPVAVAQGQEQLELVHVVENPPVVFGE